MDDGEGELALGQILAHALVAAVLARRQVHVVVADLEDEANDVDQGHAIKAGGRFCLHELDSETEQAARLVADHLEVVILGGAGEGVSPEEVHTLTTVQVDKLLSEHGDGFLVSKALDLLEGGEVDVVGRVDGLGDAEDVVGDGEATAQLGGVLDVVDEKRGLVQHADDPGNDVKARGGDVEPGIEGSDELGTEVLARVGGHVVIRTADNLFLVFGPRLLGREVEVLVGIARRVRGRRRLRRRGDSGLEEGRGHDGAGCEGLLLADPVGFGGVDDRSQERGRNRRVGVAVGVRMATVDARAGSARGDAAWWCKRVGEHVEMMATAGR